MEEDKPKMADLSKISKQWIGVGIALGALAGIIYVARTIRSPERAIRKYNTKPRIKKPRRARRILRRRKAKLNRQK